jgi:hypothetical protein
MIYDTAACVIGFFEVPGLKFIDLESVIAKRAGLCFDAWASKTMIYPFGDRPMARRPAGPGALQAAGNGQLPSEYYRTHI